MKNLAAIFALAGGLSTVGSIQADAADFSVPVEISVSGYKADADMMAQYWKAKAALDGRGVGMQSIEVKADTNIKDFFFGAMQSSAAPVAQYWKAKAALDGRGVGMQSIEVKVDTNIKDFFFGAMQSSAAPATRLWKAKAGFDGRGVGMKAMDLNF